MTESAKFNQYIDLLILEKKALEKKVEELEAYTKHKEDCSLVTRVGFHRHDVKCTCGLTKLLNANK